MGCPKNVFKQKKLYMGLVKVFSWNISGCNHPIKHKKIISYLKQLGADIAMIQVTHLNKEESEKFKKDGSTDQEGRWVTLDAQLDNQKVNIMNIYALNVLCPDFFHEICNVIRTVRNHNIILGGDFNQVRDIYLDRSGDRQRICQTCTVIDTVMEELSLINIWRMLHPLEIDCTFFSHPHQTHSQIDYILVSKSLVNHVQNSSIGNIVISDHAPVDIIINSFDSEEKTIRWRFNNSLLQNDASTSFIMSAMEEYWTYNDGSSSDPGTVWDAFKPVLRGRLIQYCSYQKRKDILFKRKLNLPISLGNVDGKILAKILSNRLDCICPTIIHQDQVGFIRGPSSADNLRRLLHILWGNKDSSDPVMAFSLDQGSRTPVLEGRNPACFRCFLLPTHLIQMISYSSSSAEAG
uniref:Endonuclease/exonuclease/phosphatase domain-containing protein n=1 Tax=Stegastes partitus TaxID=144197 RepID=A0A3B5A6X1_9TELE